MNDIELLIAVIKFYKEYIDAPSTITEEERSNLLMIARNYDNEAISRNLYA